MTPPKIIVGSSIFAWILWWRNSIKSCWSWRFQLKSPTKIELTAASCGQDAHPCDLSFLQPLKHVLMCGENSTSERWVEFGESISCIVETSVRKHTCISMKTFTEFCRIDHVWVMAIIESYVAGIHFSWVMFVFWFWFWFWSQASDTVGSKETHTVTWSTACVRYSKGKPLRVVTSCPLLFTPRFRNHAAIGQACCWAPP